MHHSSCFGLGRIFHFGPIIALIVVFICYTVAVIDSMVWLLPPKTSFWGQINILVLTMWLGLILRNFFRAILGGPGYIPLHWKPNPESDSKYLQFCKVCQGYKPPRAHHCRVCGRCVMKMDHHCPWINNCVGHYNHTNFVLFVFFAPVGCLHALIVCIATVWYQLFHRAEYLRIAYRPVHFSVHALLLTIFASGLAFGTIVAVGILFYQQLKNVVRNSTGIEQWIIEKAEDRRSESVVPMPDFIYPYNLGLKNNFLQVINARCTPVGSGYTWPVVKECNQYTLTIEQVMQKRAKQERLVRFDVIHSYSGRWFPITKGLCTCLRFPCTDESRIALRPGEKLMVSRGNKYWLYGDKILDEESMNKGMRDRGWFPRSCVLRTPVTELRNNGET